MLVPLLILAACRPPDSGRATRARTEGGTSVRIELEGAPALGEAPVLVYVLEGGEGVSGAEVEVTGDMTHAGMVPVIATATETEAGLYRADAFEFTMAGDWILTAEVTLPDGARATSELDVTVPGD